MSDDIRRGDVVVCVSTDPRLGDNLPGATTALRLLGVGRHYRVIGVIPPAALCLSGVTHPFGGGYHVARFRKLNDGEEDAELIARIKSCKPIKQPAICELPRVETQPRRLTNRDAWPPEVWDEMQRIYRGDAS